MLRDVLLQRVSEDLLGPSIADETIQARPSDEYLTGILWPRDAGVADADFDEATDDGLQDSPVAFGDEKRPRSCGLTFAVPSSGDVEFIVALEFGCYRRLGREKRSVDNGTWKRRSEQVAVRVALSAQRQLEMPAFVDSETGLKLSIFVRQEILLECRIVTVIVINTSEPIGDSTDVDIDERCAFQFGFEVQLTEGLEFIPQPTPPGTSDPETRSADLLYRNCTNFATGLQVSAEWASDGVPSKISTTWIPRETIPSFSTDGDPIFSKMLAPDDLSAKLFGECSIADSLGRLTKLCEAYETWIEKVESLSSHLAETHARTASLHLDQCRLAAQRMRAGIAILESNAELAKAFQLANIAMDKQYRWKNGAASELRWRPFQIGFILLCLESTINPESLDRETFDLLWFPTGGGKTEAYLGLIAIAAFYRIINKPHIAQSGPVAVMRYTLRLLTAQQFQRAAALMLASEIIAHKFIPTEQGRFSIGLWVGGDATPNSYKDAQSKNRQNSSPEQLTECPACKSKLVWRDNRILQRFRPHCIQPSCEVAALKELPVCTVDDDIYQTRPTLIIGTIDKFAQLPFQPRIKQMLDISGALAPELVIQDELHLISGPLGTVAGLYEMALDWLLRKNGARPKVIGSTATIKRATEQIRALFDRTSFQFPPAGIDFDNSGFACVDNDAPGRLYVGVTTAGRSAKFAIQALAGSLAQGASWEYASNPLEADGYMTALMYFNSLRELGGAVVQGQDDVPDSIASYAGRRAEPAREIGAPLELTSRVTQQEIVDTLAALEKPYSSGVAPDLVLATNMVSVGVDVPRLGLMILQGTPKARAEYIQASSRVGRSKSSPGIVFCVYNAAKARDRSQFETFTNWHQSVYRDVEPTSVTPFASRARDKALHSALVSMLRQASEGLHEVPNHHELTADNVSDVLDFIESRVAHVDPDEIAAVTSELDQLLSEWIEREPKHYKRDADPDSALLQSAELASQRAAQGKLRSPAWPTMNNMRSVEASTPFRLTEVLKSGLATGETDEVKQVKSWRKDRNVI